MGLLVEGENVFVGEACLKVDDGGGVDGDAEVAGLEMEMGAGGAPCVTAECNRFAGFYDLVGLHEETGEVTVDGLHAVVVAHDDVVAVTATFIFCETDFAGEGRADCVANMEGDVGAIVHAAEAWTIAEGGGDGALDGEVELGDVEVFAVGDRNGAAVGVYACAFPEGAEDVGISSGLAGFNLVEEEIVVFDFEGVCRGLLVGYEGVVLLGVRSREPVLSRCRERGDGHECDGEESIKFEKFHFVSKRSFKM